MKKKVLSIVSFCIILITLFSTVAFADVFSTPTLDELYAPKIVGMNTACNYVKLQVNYPYEDGENKELWVYRSLTGKKGSWTKIAVTKCKDGDIHTYTDKKVKVNTTYYYIVKTCQYFKENGKTYKMLYTSDRYKTKTVPTKPEFSYFGENGYGTVMKWKARSEVSGYKIYRSESAKKGTWTCIAHVKSNKSGSFTDKNLEIGSRYYYCFKAYQTYNGKNYYSSDSKVHLNEIADLHAPTDFSVESTEKGVYISFDEVYACRGYLIYRSSTGQKGTWTKIATIKDASETSFLDTEAKDGEEFFYTVKSFKTLNGKNYYSGDARKAYSGLTLTVSGNRYDFYGLGTEKCIVLEANRTPEAGELIIEIEDESVAKVKEIEWDSINRAWVTVVSTGSGETTFKAYYKDYPYTYCEVKLEVTAKPGEESQPEKETETVTESATKEVEN